MSQHMVIFQNPEGDPGYNQFESIEEAVGFVEKIRNEQGIDSIRIFELEEVKFDLKPYYKVELLALRPGGAPAPAAPPAPAAAPAPAPVPEAPSSAPDIEPASPFAPPAPQDAPAAFPPPSGSPLPPTPPADQPDEDAQPTRRGLFGR